MEFIKEALEAVPEEDHFVTTDGKTIKSLRELAVLFNEMSDEVFDKHVSKDKNEFAEWVKKVHRKEELARELMEDLTRDGHEKIMLRHIVRDYRE